MKWCFSPDSSPDSSPTIVDSSNYGWIIWWWWIWWVMAMALAKRNMPRSQLRIGGAGSTSLSAMNHRSARRTRQWWWMRTVNGWKCMKHGDGWQWLIMDGSGDNKIWPGLKLVLLRSKSTWSVIDGRTLPAKTAWCLNATQRFTVKWEVIIYMILYASPITYSLWCLFTQHEWNSGSMGHSVDSNLFIFFLFISLCTVLDVNEVPRDIILMVKLASAVFKAQGGFTKLITGTPGPRQWSW